jgi:hypothetical protein
MASAATSSITDPQPVRILLGSKSRILVHKGGFSLEVKNTETVEILGQFYHWHISGPREKSEDGKREGGYNCHSTRSAENAKVTDGENVNADLVN